MRRILMKGHHRNSFVSPAASPTCSLSLIFAMLRSIILCAVRCQSSFANASRCVCVCRVVLRERKSARFMAIASMGWCVCVYSWGVRAKERECACEEEGGREKRRKRAGGREEGREGGREGGLARTGENLRLHAISNSVERGSTSSVARSRLILSHGLEEIGIALSKRHLVTIKKTKNWQD